MLGLISFLREQRKCKVVILLNKGELGDGGLGDFNEYSEKVIDVTLKFEPEPQDSVRIALPGTTAANNLIGENCIKLGISNIRVIKQIERYVHMINPTVKDFDEAVFRQTVHSLTLFTWGKYQPGVAPSLEYLKTKRSNAYLGLLKAEDIPAGEAAWNALLDVYKFTDMDELDLALLEGIENGFFDFEDIEKLAAELDKKITLLKKNNTFSDAWNLYHDSFSDNEDEVIDAIYNSFKKGLETITPVNLNATISLFKDLGHEKKAEELIKIYVEKREGSPEFWGLKGHHHFPGDVTDEDIIAAFEAKLASFKVEFDPVHTLLEIAKQHSWNSEDIRCLASVSSEEYYKIFKEHSGDDLSTMISTALDLLQK